MKETITVEGNRHYECGLCGFAYEEKEWAEKCEAWCSAHGSCNMDITEHAVQRKVKHSSLEERS